MSIKVDSVVRGVPQTIRFDDNTAGNPQPIPADVQVIRTGTFNFGPQGELTITTDMLRSMVKNFTDKVRGVDLAIDYKHDSDDVAAGWINSIYLMNDDQELWANVKWTPKGRQVLSDKEFRYLSADFHLNFQNNETNIAYGPTLFGAGLTNRPFIKEMKPVILSEKMKGKQMDDKDKTIADLQAQIAALQKQIDSGNPDGDGDEDKQLAAPKVPPAPPADPAKENEELKAKCADMQKKLDGYEVAAAEADKQKKLSEKKNAFDALMRAGKAVEAQRVHFMSGNTTKFAEAFVQPNLSGSGSSVIPPVTAMDNQSAQATIIQLAQEKVKADASLNIGEAIRMVLSENSELKTAYQG